jgi:hypothetical protein
MTHWPARTGPHLPGGTPGPTAGAAVGDETRDEAEYRCEGEHHRDAKHTVGTKPVEAAPVHGVSASRRPAAPTSPPGNVPRTRRQATPPSNAIPGDCPVARRQNRDHLVQRDSDNACDRVRHRRPQK